MKVLPFRRLCRYTFPGLVYGKIKRTVLNGGYDVMAGKVRDDFSRASQERLSSLDFAGKESFLSLIQRLENRDH
jgi:hypothetical protein